MPKRIKITNDDWDAFVRSNVEHIGKELYERLIVVCINMNIDIKDLLNSVKDYNSFWALVNKYYNDYVDTTDLEEVD